MIKFDENKNITEEYKNYVSNLEREELEIMYIGADAYVDRLNNVLNEIYENLMFDYKNLDVKKLKLDGMDNSITDLTDSYWLGYIDACEEVFDRINELKESNK